jgi:ATP-dependent RNA helicase RhlE
MQFSELGLSPAIVAALSRLDIKEARPVQAMAIPPALAGRDLLVLSPTGSGKTIAFAAPLLEALATRPGEDPGRGGSGVGALVLVPTRELAVQVASVFEAMAEGLPRKPRIRVVHGGVSINPQMLALRGGADVLVATPGRLLDLACHNAARLDDLRFLVLDEADRILDEGFRVELAEVLSLLPSSRQTLLFSATFSGTAAEVLGPVLKDPLRLGEEAPPHGGAVRHEAYAVAPEDKGPFLRSLISEHDWKRVLVFASSNRRVDNVTRKLNNNGIPALALHGDLSQAARSAGLEDFREGAIRVLVASDLASRGLDIMGLPCVINYEFPRSPLDYIHRAGRTGRIDAEGLVLSLVAPEDEAMLRVIEKKSRLRIPLIRGLGPGARPEAPSAS